MLTVCSIPFLWNMKTLVVGATGATGKQVVNQLLEEGLAVKAIVRSLQRIPAHWNKQNKLELIEANLLDMSDVAMSAALDDCSSIVSCLGHNLSWKGIYGKPRKLVSDAAKRLCANVPEGKHVNYLLMNTAGNSNRDLDEPISFGQKLVLGLIRLLLPPHTDNEQAADFLRTEIGQNHPQIAWVAVRPDSLIDEDSPTAYELHPSPTTSAIFKPGKTSRSNVAHFMVQLIQKEDLWTKWKGQMPIIYNKGSAA